MEEKKDRTEFNLQTLTKNHFLKLIVVPILPLQCAYSKGGFCCFLCRNGIDLYLTSNCS